MVTCPVVATCQEEGEDERTSHHSAELEGHELPNLLPCILLSDLELMGRLIATLHFRSSSP